MHQRRARMSRIVEPYPFDAEPVEYPSPSEREQIWVVGLSGLIARDVFAQPVPPAERHLSSDSRLRAARSTSTTSAGMGSVRVLALDLGVPDRICLPTPAQGRASEQQRCADPPTPISGKR
jgi:hypothetical protein